MSLWQKTKELSLAPNNNYYVFDKKEEKLTLKINIGESEQRELSRTDKIYVAIEEPEKLLRIHPFTHATESNTDVFKKDIELIKPSRMNEKRDWDIDIFEGHLLIISVHLNETLSCANIIVWQASVEFIKNNLCAKILKRAQGNVYADPDQPTHFHFDQTYSPWKSLESFLRNETIVRNLKLDQGAIGPPTYANTPTPTRSGTSSSN